MRKYIALISLLLEAKKIVTLDSFALNPDLNPMINQFAHFAQQYTQIENDRQKIILKTIILQKCGMKYLHIFFMNLLGKNM